MFGRKPKCTRITLEDITKAHSLYICAMNAYVEFTECIKDGIAAEQAYKDVLRAKSDIAFRDYRELHKAYVYQETEGRASGFW